MISVTSSFWKRLVFKLFPFHFEERFRDGFVWTVGLTVEIKMRFQILWRSVDVAFHHIKLTFSKTNRSSFSLTTH